MNGEAQYSLICLEGVQLSAVIGCEEWERRSPKRLTVDIILAIDAAQAVQSDAVEGTINYAQVVQRVVAFAAESQFQLLESLVDGIADLILAEFSVPWLHLKLSKPRVLRGVEAF
ncbi:MAG: dihydroneopterin aldolase [Gammaproteobacteria bacterium]